MASVASSGKEVRRSFTDCGRTPSLVASKESSDPSHKHAMSSVSPGRRVGVLVCDVCSTLPLCLRRFR